MPTVDDSRVVHTERGGGLGQLPNTGISAPPLAPGGIWPRHRRRTVTADTGGPLDRARSTDREHSTGGTGSPPRLLDSGLNTDADGIGFRCLEMELAGSAIGGSRSKDPSKFA